jgi:DinB superfamily
MHPRLAELMEYAEAQRTALLGAVGTVPDGRGEERVSPECWSVAEVLEHLHRVERGLIRLTEYAAQQVRERGIGPERQAESVLGVLDSFQLPRRISRIPAPDRVLPSGQYTIAQMLPKLGESRRALLGSLPALDGLALGEITFPHPLLGPLSVYQWLLFLGQHEARHTDQIREIVTRLNERPSTTRGEFA